MSKQNNDMCYITSAGKFKQYSNGEIITVEVNDGEKYVDPVMKNSTIYNIEFSIKVTMGNNSLRKKVLEKVMKIYGRNNLVNFVFKYDELRCYLHAFNIYVTEDKITFGQSWYNLQPYHFYHKDEVVSVESFVNNLLTSKFEEVIKSLDYTFSEKTVLSLESINEMYNIITSEKCSIKKKMIIHKSILKSNNLLDKIIY